MPHIYVRAWLVCFHSLISTQNSEGAGSIRGQLHRDEKCPFRGISSSGRVWRRVSENDAQSVGVTHT